jgi:gliding motility-associated-like protein
LCFIFSIAKAQYLQNGAMEGPVTGNNTPPDDWGVCDVFSTPELRDTFARPGVTVISPDLSKFTILRLRGENNDPAGTGEHLFTRLISPLEKGFCYEFSAWLYHTYDGSNAYTTYPAKLQLWGGLDSCSMDELLYESEMITTNDTWREYHFNFVVENQDYPYFYIRPYWDFENVSEHYYDGIIIMDNLDIQQRKPVDLPLMDTVYYSFDEPLQLRAGEGISYSWSPPEVVSDPLNRDPVLLEYVDTIEVIVLDQDYCPVRERYRVLVNCDSLYKDDILNRYEIYYSYDKEIILTASEGNTYDWEPQVNLSGYDIRNPILTDYSESYIVAVEDDYGCLFNEQFLIIPDCDTLYSQKSFISLDTLLHLGEGLVLMPEYGSPAGQWSPVDGLSCTECYAPEAYPLSSTNYQVQLSDQFSCIHEEIFVIEVSMEVPNVITPNDDGYNDEFIVRGLPPGSTIQIFDKDGTLLYRNASYGYPEWWNGTDSNGKQLATGNYWYVLEIPAMAIVKKDFIFLKR